MAKKLTSGKGWSFEPAGRREAETVVSLPDELQKVKITLEKRPKGKEATVVGGFVLSDADRKALAASLKKLCGAGGSEASGRVEVQGDHREAVAAKLRARGWRVG